MAVHKPGMVQTCALCIAGLSISLPAASLHGRENSAETTKTVLLAPGTEAQSQQLIVISAPEHIAPATPAGASSGPLPPPEQIMTPDASIGEAISPAGDTSGNVTRQPPAPGRLFGSDDSEDLFGLRGGFIHPSLQFREEWTDNIYNIDEGRQSNLLTMVSPGIWLGFPRMEEVPLRFTLNNGAIGGHRFLVADSETFERFQGFLSATAEFKYYSATSELNDTAWRAEAFARYNLPAGLSLHVLDSFSVDRDRFDQGSFQQQETPSGQQGSPDSPSPSFIRNYTANMVNTALEYAATDRYTLNFDYTNFLLVYDDENDWLNRSDNSFTLSLSYHFTPKTSLLAEYSHALVSYEEQEVNDSSNTFIYTGLNWKGSSRISLSAKGGYQIKEFSNSGETDTGIFSMEAAFDYLISEKTNISFRTYKALEETNTLGERGMDTLVAKLRYEQQFSYRLRGVCELHYELNDHAVFSESRQPGAGEPRKDTTYAVKPAIDYLFRDWLTVELAYAYETRDSSDNSYNYSTQTVMLSLNFAL